MKLASVSTDDSFFKIWEYDGDNLHETKCKKIESLTDVALCATVGGTNDIIATSTEDNLV